MMLQTGQQVITTHILPNISRSKCNKEMEFSQLIKYNMRNIFLQKSCRKWVRKTNSRPLFGRPWSGHTIKANFTTFQTDDPSICSILFFHAVFH